MIEAHGKKFIVLSGTDGALVLDAASVIAIEGTATLTNVFVAFGAATTTGTAGGFDGATFLVTDTVDAVMALVAGTAATTN